MIKPEELFEFLGFDPKEVDSIDKFKDKFQPEFARVSSIHERKDVLDPIWGKKMGSLETKAKQAAKKYGVEFAPEEVKGKPVDEVYDLLLEKMATANLSTVKELEGKVGQNNDDAIKEWQTKYQKLESKYKDTEGLLKNTNEEFGKFKESSLTQIKSSKIDYLKKDLFGKVKFKPGIEEVELKGYRAHIEENFDLDFDESGNEFIKDKKTGQRIPSTKVTGKFKDPLEVLQDEAVKLKVYQMNEHGGKPVQKQTAHTPQTQQTPVNPGFMFNQRKMSSRVK